MSPGLHIAFAGTPEFAASILEQLIKETSHTISFIYTQPDRPAGRGKKLHKSPVKELAEKYLLNVKQPGNRVELEQDPALGGLDVLIVAAFGMILPATILARPRYGCINIHTSLLPRWRGAAPVQRAILAGDTESGITIMQMDAGLDTGDILYKKSCAIEPEDTAGTLYSRLAMLGGESIRLVLDMIVSDSLNPVRQDETGATYAHKIQKSEARIDWIKPAVEIERLVRAFNPAPVAYAELNNITVRIWQVAVQDQTAPGIPPGNIVHFSPEGIDITTGDKIIRVLKLQLPGKKVMTTRDFFNGNPGFWPVAGHKGC